MRKLLLTIFLLLILLGGAMKINEIFQPFRLRSFTVEGATPQLEMYLHNWASQGLAFFPKLLFKKQQLKTLETQFPVKFEIRTRLFKGEITATILPLIPMINIHWRGVHYVASPEGKIWEINNSYGPQISQANTSDVIKIDDPITLFWTKGNSLVYDIAYPMTKIANVLTQLQSIEGLITGQTLIFKRGGEELVKCQYRKGQDVIELWANINHLDSSIPVVKTLINDGNKRNGQIIDATYTDKVFIRKATPQ